MSAITTITESIGKIRQNANGSRSQDVIARFNYYLPPVDGSNVASTDDLELILGTKDQDARLLRVIDVRGKESNFTLDTNGFRYVQLRTALKDTISDQHIKNVYYPELDAMLKREL